jgi:hypothetical protein
MRDAEKAPGQIVSPASLQARKVVELKKAERDLILVRCVAARLRSNAFTTLTLRSDGIDPQVTHFLATICAFLAGYLLWITITFSGVMPPSEWFK